MTDSITPPLPPYWPADTRYVNEEGTATLNPCPFCGGKAVMFKDTKRTSAHCRCASCGAESAAYEWERDARHVGPGERDYLSASDWCRERWNRRVPFKGEKR